MAQEEAKKQYNKLLELIHNDEDASIPNYIKVIILEIEALKQNKYAEYLEQLIMKNLKSD